MKKVPVHLPFHKTIYQSGSGQPVTSDTELLVQTVLQDNPDCPQKVLDLGTGCGIIPIMLKHYRPSWICTGIDIQPQLIELARENSVLADVEIEFFTADLRKQDFPHVFDLIISNPPFLKTGSGKIPPVRERALARYEITCNLTDLIMVVKNNLSKSGSAYLIYPESRTREIEKNTKNIDLMINDKFILATEKEPRIIFKLKRELGQSGRII